jgi:Tol biopolymer transport system component
MIGPISIHHSRPTASVCSSSRRVQSRSPTQRRQTRKTWTSGTSTARLRDGAAPEWIKAVSSPGKEGSPTVTRDGTLYFFSDRDAKPDQDSIYVSRLVNGEYAAPVKLPATVNSGVYDASPFVAPNGKTLLFYSTRSGGSGGGDLYVSFFKHGQWQQAINLGKAVNTTEWEYSPCVSPDGKRLYFGRSRQFYQIPIESIGLKELKPSRFTS